MAYPIGYFKDRVRAEPDWIIPHFLKRHNNGFIIGEPKKACKSWLLSNLAWDLSEGKPVWGVKDADGAYLFTPPRPMRVAYIAQEDSEDDYHDRADILFRGGRTGNENFWIIPKNLRMQFDTQAGIQLIAQELDMVAEAWGGKLDLILFDPMRRLHGQNENDSQVIAKLWSVLDTMHKKYNCATLFSHHIIKPPSSSNSQSHFDASSPFTARGSGDIYGGGDAFINVVPKKVRGRLSRKTRVLELHFETKRSSPIDSVIVTVDFSSGGVIFNGLLEEETEEGQADKLDISVFVK